MCQRVSPLKMLKSLPLVPVNATLFENRVSADDRGRKRSLGWALIPCHSCPYGKGTFEHRDRHTQREESVKIQGGDSLDRAQKHPRLQELGERSGAEASSQPVGGAETADTWTLAFQPPDLKR